ncbi:MAG: hypothetical protein P4N59_04680, partial [Negativicutes bacterium]|nr:hypothetical protein [Negativicutes bacterium]
GRKTAKITEAADIAPESQIKPSLEKARSQKSGFFYCQYADSHGFIMFRRCSIAVADANPLIRRDLIEQWYFPYTAQSFSWICKTEKFCRIRLRSSFIPLV